MNCTQLNIAYEDSSRTTNIPSTSLKILTGNFYKTRDGKKALVREICDDQTEHKVLGTIECHGFVSWLPNGSKYRSKETPLDIIANWEN